MADVLLLSLPRSGTHLVRSLIDSHPETSCAFGASADVGVFHYPGIKWDWLTNKKVILLTRDYFNGAISDLSTNRASGIYTLPVESVRMAVEKRRRYTELLKPYADLVVSYEEMTGGAEIGSWDCDELCDLLGVGRCTFRTKVKKREAQIPSNLEELYASTI